MEQNSIRKVLSDRLYVAELELDIRRLSAVKEGLEKEKIVLGGCIVTEHDPRWECNSYHHRWGERED